MGLKETYWDSDIFIFIRRTVFIRLIRRIYYELKMLLYVLQNSLAVHFIRRLKGHSHEPVTQSSLSWRLSVNQIKSYDDLKDYLVQNNLLFCEGGNTIYIPPQQNLELLFGKMRMFYPADSGFKILKHFQPPEKASYVGYGDYISQGDCYLRRIMTGSVKDQIDAANVLNIYELGPALYDVTELYANEVRMTCFVVQHITGSRPSFKDYSKFIKKLKSLIDSKTFALIPPEGLDFIDFKAPDCNKNLIKSILNDKLMYVDFQQFILRDKKELTDSMLSEARKEFHFGDSRMLRGNKYLYQSIPGTSKLGKRDIEKRWLILENLLRKTGLHVSNRIVLDIGCNAGMMLSSALAKGSLWGLGWDMPNVIEQTKRLNTLLGNNRVDFFSAKLSEAYSISQDIPERLHSLLPESIVFYLAVWKHFGFISEIAKIPWKALIFEGHDGDTFESLKEIFKKIQSDCNCTIAVKSDVKDGDCGLRPIVVFVRY